MPSEPDSWPQLLTDEAVAGQEILLYSRESLVPEQAAGPVARVSPRNGWANWLVWSDDGTKLAYTNGVTREDWENPIPAGVSVVTAPDFVPREVPLDPARSWQPVCFSPDGRYLVVVTQLDIGQDGAGVVFDTLTGAVSALPPEIDTDEMNLPPGRAPPCSAPSPTRRAIPSTPGPSSTTPPRVGSCRIRRFHRHLHGPGGGNRHRHRGRNHRGL